MAKPKPFKLPERWPRRSRVEVDSGAISHILKLCERALYYDAWKIAAPLGPLQSWSGLEARLAASALANHAGGRRLGDLLDMSCFREQPRNGKAQYGYLATVRSRRGPLAAWRVLRSLDLEGHPPEQRARLLALKAWIAQDFRDFDAAEEWLCRARSAWPDAAWNSLMEASLLESRDRPEAALEAAERSLAARDWYAPAVARTAECLKVLNRELEAVALIKAAFDHVQDPHLAAMLAGIFREKEDFAAMLDPLDMFERWSPFLEPPARRWLLGTRAEALYRCGRLEEAASCAAEAGTDYQTGFAERLRSQDHPAKRVRLAVGFVRQRHNTCAPATLAALASFWGLPVLEKEIADEICYDGAYDLHQRRWAEDAGCRVREFRVTWESARALIDRGIPFAMVTSTPTSSHLQAVIGYDEKRNALLIREPSDREYCEFEAGKFFQDHAAIGPRGMALTPIARRELLENLELPESDLYDRLYMLNGALEEHDRARAVALCEEMKSSAPGHRLDLVARRMLAGYDCNVPAQLAGIEGLLALFPGDERLELSRIYCLRDLDRREARLESLARLCGKKDAHPVFWKEYAVELADDARLHREALRYLRRAHQATPWLASVVSRMAHIYWQQRRIEESVELYRFAFCADDKDEGRARSFFIACRHVRKTAEALDLLRLRFATDGKKSGDPARTLFRALDDVDRTHEALEVLEEAIRLRPDDCVLMLFAADQYANYNRSERVSELLTAAGKVSQGAAWLRTSARLALNRGEPLAALEFWKQVTALEALAKDAHGALARLLEQTEGRDRALEHLRDTCEIFPHNFELNQLWLERLREKSDLEAEPVARKLVDINPADAWARRELAAVLSSVGKLDEALAEAEIALGLNPSSSFSHSSLGAIEKKRGQFSRAREALHEAVRLDVDNGYAIETLLAVCSSAEPRRQELEFVRSELIRQVVFGDGLITYRREAQRILNPSELLRSLKEALDARPDLWHSWSAYTNQLVSCDRVQEALAQAEEMTRRFPLTAGSWRMLGTVHDIQHDWRAAASAYEHALEISPNWSSAVTELSEAYEHAGDQAAARQCLEHAVARNPLDDRIHASLAHVLWNAGEKDNALSHLRQSVKLNPGYDWAWSRLREWGPAGETLEMARELTVLRGGEARSWFILAESLTAPQQAGERLDALEKAIGLNPQFTDAHDLKAELFCEQKRYDEALAVCEAPVWHGNPPTTLRGRAAWVERQRGGRKEAIRRMKAALADDENYSWGWQQMAEWLEEEEEYIEALNAAEKMVRWNPRRAMSFGYRADAKLNVGDRYGALDDLKKALSLDSEYGFAGWKLFDLKLEDDQLDEAAGTLAVLRGHCAADRLHGAEVKIALRRGCIGEAVDAFSKLAALEEAEGRAFDGLADEFSAANALDNLDSTLQNLLENSRMNRSAARFWAQREAAKKRWDLLPDIERFLAHDKTALGAIGGWLDALGDARRRPPRWRRLLTRHGERLRSESYIWGILGYALQRAGMNREAAEWLAGWRQRKDCEPWMLINLTTALRALGRHTPAHDASLWAVEQGSSEYPTVVHRCYCGVDEAVDNRPAEALAMLAPIRKRKLNAREQFLLLCADSIIAVLNARGAAKPAAFKEALRKLGEAALAIEIPDAAIVNTCRRAVRKMASEAGEIFHWRHTLFVRRAIFRKPVTRNRS